jgi:hypothetical protein
MIDALKLQSATEWNWDVDENGPFKTPCRPKNWRGFEDVIYVAYDERTWTSLMIRHERMRALAEAVKHHFLDAEKLALLASSGIALLGLPSATLNLSEESKEGHDP